MSSEKPYDIVVFGASGYTGRLVAEYLAQEYPNDDLSWAMAGRSLEKLGAVRDRFHKASPQHQVCREGDFIHLQGKPAVRNYHANALQIEEGDFLHRYLKSLREEP